MAFGKKTVKDIDVKNKTVLVRVDYNVLNDKGEITEDYRIKASKPTIDYLLENNCKIILATHAGRPEGKPVMAYSLSHIVDRVSEVLGQPVQFLDDQLGPVLKSRVEGLQPKQIALLENLRFYAAEEANDADFAKQLAGLAEVLVQDAFGNAHRKHASMDAITKFIPGVSGLLLEKEVSAITETMSQPQHPLVVIMGGAKVSDKIELINRFTQLADQIFIGGAMANTFFKELGENIGKSIYEKGQADTINNLKDKVSLPAKVAVATSLDKDAPRAERNRREVQDDEYILDVDLNGNLAAFATSKTIIWNGPVGMTEMTNFRQGSRAVANSIIESGAKSIVGGGDTAAFVEQEGLTDKFYLVSTGGGASLELMAGKKLPGVEALLDQ